MTELNPDDFIITRKRKKYRFALFANSPICLEFEDWQKRSVDVLEIGAGTGLFSAELAQRYPDKQFLALDVKGDRLQKGAKKAEELGLKNVFFIRARADQLPEIIDDDSLQTIWLTFPDPFPRKRSSGRRMTHPNFLKIYQRILKLEGRFYLKHDNLDFFCWSLEQLVQSGWQLKELSFDLHDSTLSDGYKLLTTYEQRWINEGATINLVSAQPKKP